MTVYVRIKEDGTIVVYENKPADISTTAYEIENMDEGLITLIQTLRGL